MGAKLKDLKADKQGRGCFGASISSGAITARHWATGEPVHVTWRDGRILSVEPSSQLTEKIWIAPALIDLQVNGFAGVDFQSDDVSLSRLLEAVRELGNAGCARFLLTLVTDEWSGLLRRLRALRELRLNSPELRCAIAGWHIEGPFLSAEPGFCGAHDPQWMRDPTTADIRELRDAAGDDLLLLTMAPERPGAIEAIQLAVSLGVRVCLGHTNATSEILHRAMQAGAMGFTHLGNACPRQLDRHDNILWRVLDLPLDFHVSLIPDAIHVSPALFRLVHRLRKTSLFYVSDAISAAAAPAGRHTMGRLALEVGSDQIVRFPGGTNFAGSALRPIDGVFRAAGMMGCEWQQTWNSFSGIPASLIGMSCALEAGAPAHFCLIDEGTQPSATATTPQVTPVIGGNPRPPTFARV